MHTEDELRRLRRRVDTLEENLRAALRKLGMSWSEPGDEPPAEVVELVTQGRKKDAIREYRESTGASLKESKEYVEALARSMGLGRR